MLEMNAELEQYILSHSEPEDPLLSELTRSTFLHVLRPRMLSGNLQGQFLKMICRMTGARRILEIGTYTGYSAIAMASGLSEGGCLHTIDINDELEDFTREYIEKSGLSRRIVFHVGDARKVIPTIDEVFDLVFIDADKREYSDYYRLVFDRVRPGGVIIADDVLWNGKVLEPVGNPDAQTKGILDFNALVQSDVRVENILLPIRHGLMLIRKK
ncbi:O-methyltransferase [Gabonibacter chumensis]|uniref:O-methyltransferase n=1 Tax=Gabonibacter chumensis TaxID=2972474 RepID=UPI002573FDFE|nr:O-methyltransferase [Gabonibacter chumensis]MCR9011713.1 O-methyltransferase [Gabonibacter chumensis]